MTSKELTVKLEKIGILPMAAFDTPEDAVRMCGALLRGGIAAVEITFRTPAAQDAIQYVTRAYPQMMVGAGTVLTVQQADQAIEAGAQFIVTPGLKPDVVQHCLGKETLIIPGCITPSEIEHALTFGLSVLKFFPAEAAGGIEMIKALAGPYPEVRFLPTGGINRKNLMDYLRLPNVVACGGSFMLNGDAAVVEKQAAELSLDLQEYNQSRAEEGERV